MRRTPEEDEVAVLKGGVYGSTFDDGEGVGERRHDDGEDGPKHEDGDRNYDLDVPLLQESCLFNLCQHPVQDLEIGGLPPPR